jgi:hypothetical protein
MANYHYQLYADEMPWYGIGIAVYAICVIALWLVDSPPEISALMILGILVVTAPIVGMVIGWVLMHYASGIGWFMDRLLDLRDLRQQSARAARGARPSAPRRPWRASPPA